MAGPEPEGSQFSRDQQVRADALLVARESLINRGTPFGNTTLGDAGCVDLVDLAEYIVRGVHPHDRLDQPVVDLLPAAGGAGDVG